MRTWAQQGGSGERPGGVAGRANAFVAVFPMSATLRVAREGLRFSLRGSPNGVRFRESLDVPIWQAGGKDRTTFKQRRPHLQQC